MAAARRRVIAAQPVARGAQLHAESAGALRGGEERVDLLVGQLGGELVVRLTKATRVAGGDTMDLWFTPESLYLFDGETGESLRTDEVRAQ